MAYSDSIRNGAGNFEAVANLTDGLLVEYQELNLSASISTSSATPVDYTSASITFSVAAGEIVEIYARVATSMAAAIGVAVGVVGISEDGVDITEFNSTMISLRNNTSGNDVPFVVNGMRAPSVGNHTYKIRWSLTSTTFYSASAVFIVKKYQNT